MYLLKFTKQAAKDAKRLKGAGLDEKAKQLLRIIEQNPFSTPPSYEALVGNLSGMYSRRISIKHRLVYLVADGTVREGGEEYEGIVKVLRMWSHYESIR